MSGVNGATGSSGTSGSSGVSGTSPSLSTNLINVCQNSVCNNTQTHSFYGTVCNSGAFAENSAINYSYNSVIISGFENVFDGVSGTCVYNGAIGGGYVNQIVKNCNSAIVGGFGNKICQGGDYSAIGSGNNNSITAQCGAIPGGYFNAVSGARGIAYGYYITAATQETAVYGISKWTDNFHIQHPDPSKKDTHYLVHRTIESPSSGENIYRFQINACNCQATLELPSYYKYLNCNDYISISPTNHFGNGYGIMSQDQSQIQICTNQDGLYDVFVIGTRKDIRALQHWIGVEIENPSTYS